MTLPESLALQSGQSPYAWPPHVEQQNGSIYAFNPLRPRAQMATCRANLWIVRIEQVSVKNIGGLHDGTVVIPESPVVAIAGTNGSGKSRFLRCMVAPWTYDMPESDDPDEPATIEVELSFTPDEIALQAKYLEQLDKHGYPSESLTVVRSRAPFGAEETHAQQYGQDWLLEMLKNEDLVRFLPSLNVVYIPAERRLSPHGTQFSLISINPEANARSIAQMRQNRGEGVILEDYEFEDYARTLCVAAYLPDSNGAINQLARDEWDRFLHSVNEILHPKRLLPLTQEDPSSLRILLPSGRIHGLQGLSSGERQALIIVSRVFRAGENKSSVIIDEPDAYLHPALSGRLIEALRTGLVGRAGLLVATHSPAILDNVEPSAIIRFRQAAAAGPVVSESERIDLYREAGFRSSALTQSEFLLVTEGKFDAEILQEVIPELRQATVRPAGGRRSVFANLLALKDFELPILGVVDADVEADEPDADLQEICHVWSSADLEGVFLRSEEFLAHCLAQRLFRPEFSTLASVQEAVDAAAETMQELVINELVLLQIRRQSSPAWPAPRDPNFRARIQEVNSNSTKTHTLDLESAFEQAEETWSSFRKDKLRLVRGKYILGNIVSELSDFKSKDAFLRAALAQAPEIPEIVRLREKIKALTPTRTS